MEHGSAQIGQISRIGQLRGEPILQIAACLEPLRPQTRANLFPYEGQQRQPLIRTIRQTREYPRSIPSALPIFTPIYKFLTCGTKGGGEGPPPTVPLSYRPPFFTFLSIARAFSPTYPSGSISMALLYSSMALSVLPAFQLASARLSQALADLGKSWVLSWKT